MAKNPALFEDARVIPVFFRAGSFSKNEQKWYRAPFHILQNSEGQFVEPESIGVPDVLLKQTLVDESFLQGIRGNGWEALGQELRMEPHQMGDYHGNANDWRGMHYFGMI